MATTWSVSGMVQTFCQSLSVPPGSGEPQSSKWAYGRLLLLRSKRHQRRVLRSLHPLPTRMGVVSICPVCYSFQQDKKVSSQSALFPFTGHPDDSFSVPWSILEPILGGVLLNTWSISPSAISPSPPRMGTVFLVLFWSCRTRCHTH